MIASDQQAGLPRNGPTNSWYNADCRNLRKQWKDLDRETGVDGHATEVARAQLRACSTRMLHLSVTLTCRTRLLWLVDFLAASRISFFDSFSIDRVIPLVDPSVSATACSGTLKRLPLLVIYLIFAKDS